MNKFFKRVLSGALTFAMLTGVTAMPVNTAEAKEDLVGKLVVIHTNDIHGRYENNDESLGMSSVAALKGYYVTRAISVKVQTW